MSYIEKYIRLYSREFVSYMSYIPYYDSTTAYKPEVVYSIDTRVNISAKELITILTEPSPRISVRNIVEKIIRRYNIDSNIKLIELVCPVMPDVKLYIVPGYTTDEDGKIVISFITYKANKQVVDVLRDLYSSVGVKL